MLKRLERDAIRADLASIEALLSATTEDEDPVGWLQFNQRREMLAEELAAAGSAVSAYAGVGLFFGGRPVVGSHGIIADFATKAVAEFQNLVSNAFAAAEGVVGARGPVPQRDRTKLLITDVARGSFGFILEQADEPQMVDSQMKQVVGTAIDLVYRVGSPDQEAFESVAENVERRVFASLTSFFKVLDDAGATVRVVEDQREFTLDRNLVTLGRERVEAVEWVEREETVTGILYLLPSSRRFEMHPADGADDIRGIIAPDFLQSVTGGGSEVRPGIIGTRRTVRLRVRDIQTRGQASKSSYVLLSLTDQDQTLLPPAS
ncbi:MAG: hypothetical protein K2Z25_15335 [Beijerinckiaceae bacterium]|nr:hypothetical protein [Beijerinckiaceae bacterium]